MDRAASERVYDLLLIGKPGQLTVERANLSPREIDVLALMADGLTNERIGAELHLSTKSVEGVVRSIFVKLGLFDNAHDNRRVVAVRLFLDSSVRSQVPWPAWASTFIGRVSELDELERLITQHQLIAIVGTGGIGKTRVAVAVAARMAARGLSLHTSLTSSAQERPTRPNGYSQRLVSPRQTPLPDGARWSGSFKPDRDWLCWTTSGSSLTRSPRCHRD